MLVPTYVSTFCFGGESLYCKWCSTQLARAVEREGDACGNNDFASVDFVERAKAEINTASPLILLLLSLVRSSIAEERDFDVCLNSDTFPSSSPVSFFAAI